MSKRKIIGLDTLLRIVEKRKTNGMKIVLCHGCFDLTHPGHLEYFKEAKKLGDLLVVSITCDQYAKEQKGPGRPVYPQETRSRFIAEFECVDYVIINEKNTIKDLILALKPDFYVKGSEFAENKTDLLLEEERAVESVGGKVHFLSGELILSSTELIKKYFDIYPESLQRFLEDFKKHYSSEEIVSAFEKMRDLKVLVVGETIIDDYHYGKPMLGKPSKGSGKALEFVREESFAGGVLACANHVAGFCKDVHIVSLLGGLDNSEEHFIRCFIQRHLKSNIVPYFFIETMLRQLEKKISRRRSNIKKGFRVLLF
jgi:rfaE bifunctional protein nucleotidyltransferase chain/domain